MVQAPVKDLGRFLNNARSSFLEVLLEAEYPAFETRETCRGALVVITLQVLMRQAAGARFLFASRALFYLVKSCHHTPLKPAGGFIDFKHRKPDCLPVQALLD